MPDQKRNHFVEHRPFPDVVLKSQFFDMVGNRTLTNEQRLMLAVLADAINLVEEGPCSPGMRRSDSFTEARNWIFRSAIRCPLAFEDVCDALNIDAGALRSRIRSLISAHGPSPIRLQLKEATRGQRVTVNRARRRSRR